MYTFDSEKLFLDCAKEYERMAFVPAVFYREPMAALSWLQAAFGFELSMLIEPPEGGDPRNMHAEMSLGGTGRVMVGAEWIDWARSPASLQGANTATIHVDL